MGDIKAQATKKAGLGLPRWVLLREEVVDQLLSRNKRLLSVGETHTGSCW